MVEAAALIIFATIAALYGAYRWIMRVDRDFDHMIVGEAALLDHPELPRPQAKPPRREPEPMGL